MKTPLASLLSVAVLLTALAALTTGFFPARAQEGIKIPAPNADLVFADAVREQTLVLAGGCFWGVQGVFQHVTGVTRAVSGYAGGSAAQANYNAVITGRTGHAEAVQITFDPHIISVGEILHIFFPPGTRPRPPIPLGHLPAFGGASPTRPRVYPTTERRPRL